MVLIHRQEKKQKTSAVDAKEASSKNEILAKRKKSMKLVDDTLVQIHAVNDVALWACVRSRAPQCDRDATDGEGSHA